MSETISGKISRIFENPVKTKYGVKPTYVIMLDDGTKYNSGFKKPSAAAGDEVTITYIVDTYGNKIQQVVSSSAKNTTPRNTQGDTSTFAIDKQTSIVRQNSLAHATVVVNLYHLTNKDILDTAGGKSKPKDVSLDTLTDEVLSVAKRFEKYSSGIEDKENEAKVKEAARRAMTLKDLDSEEALSVLVDEIEE